VFPDFFKQETQDLWVDLITKHIEVIPFDGIWIVSRHTVKVIPKALIFVKLIDHLNFGVYKSKR